MKRIVIINISKSEFIKYLEKFQNLNKEKNKKIKKILSSDAKNVTNLFINIIIKDKEVDLNIFENVQKTPNELTKEDKEIIDSCYKEFCDCKNNNKLDERFLMIYFYKIGAKKEKLDKIIAKFYSTPFYINYKDKTPDNQYIENIKELCILCLICYKKKNSNSYLPFAIKKKIEYFENKEEEYEKINDKKLKMFAFIDTAKYLLSVEDSSTNNLNYKLVNMEDLPKYSPYIQSEIKYRKIITELKENSKLSFLFLQFNSGAGKDLISLKTFYQIKITPLISIKYQLLKDFNPYFYVFDSDSCYSSLAFNNPQTNNKSFNEYYLKIEKENVALYESDLKTVKLLFMKIHEFSHSIYSGNYKFENSPQFVFKKNLSKFNNDKALSQGIIQNSLKYKYKNYIYKYADENKEDSEDEEDNYIDIIYNFLEDFGDDIKEQFTESNVGESGAAIEYYMSNNYFCANCIIRYKGDLSKLLNVNLFTGESLLTLKRIIEKKIRVLYKKEPKLINQIFSFQKDYYIYKNIKKGPSELLTYNDIGLLVNE